MIVCSIVLNVKGIVKYNSINTFFFSEGRNVVHLHNLISEKWAKLWGENVILKNGNGVTYFVVTQYVFYGLFHSVHLGDGPTRVFLRPS